DDRRDIDMFLLPVSGVPMLFRNLRDGTFGDVAQERGITTDAAFSCVGVGDFNKDGYPDFFLGQTDKPGTIAPSDGRGRFAVSAAPGVPAGGLGCQLGDYDNDGLLDFLTATAGGPRLLRNLGTRWADVTESAFKAASSAQSPSSGTAALASGDIDVD